MFFNQAKGAQRSYLMWAQANVDGVMKRAGLTWKKEEMGKSIVKQDWILQDF